MQSLTPVQYRLLVGLSAGNLVSMIENTVKTETGAFRIQGIHEEVEDYGRNIDIALLLRCRYASFPHLH